MKILLLQPRQLWYLGCMLGYVLLLLMVPRIINLVAIHLTLPEAIYQGNTVKPEVAIACNVFWGEEYLPDMLSTLDQNNIKVTFFIGGSWAKRNPEMLKAIAEHGHELGNHTYSHPHPSALNKEQNMEQIKQAEELVLNLTGIRTTLYAPPYGEFNDTVLSAAAEMGYRTIMWSIDTVDWKRPPPDIVISRVMKKLHNGAIILIHPTDPTAKALPELLRQNAAGGYSVTTVSNILEQ